MLYVCNLNEYVFMLTLVFKKNIILIPIHYRDLNTIRYETL